MNYFPEKVNINLLVPINFITVFVREAKRYQDSETE